MNKVPIQKVKRFRLKGRASHSKSFFGSGTVMLPATLGRTIQYLKDQAETSYCTAAARSTAGSYLWGKEMSFEYATAKEGEVAGAPIYEGTDPNTADRTPQEYGFLPNELTPLTFAQGGWITPADWRNYQPALDGSATSYIVGEPFNVYPDYDSIKQALFQGKDDGAVVVANGFWYDNWQSPVGGIAMTPNTAVTRHSYIFIDWKTINGTEYLVAQLSQGLDFGDNGLVYFSKDVLNAAFKNPAYNGLGCTIWRKGYTNPVQTQITFLTRLAMLLGELRDQLLHL